MSASDVTIIGNGIIGLAIAHALTAAGHRVTVLDRAGVDEGTSIGNASAIAGAEFLPIASPGLWKKIPGMLLDPEGPLHLRLGHVPTLIPWMARFLQACGQENFERGTTALAALVTPARDDHLAMLEAIGASDLIRGEGALYIYRSEAARAAEDDKWELLRRHGVDVFALDRKGIEQHEPALGPIARSGYFVPDWTVYRDPLDLLRALQSSLRERGVMFETGEVRGLVQAGERVSGLELTDGRTLDVGNLIIAAGAWSGRLSAQLGEAFPIEADRGYNTTIPDPGVDLKRFITFQEDSFVASPLAIGLRVGGAVEMGGLEAPPNYKRSDALLKLAKRYLPDLNTEGGTQWMGHRPGTPDSIPVISRSETAQNVIYAFGHGHLGLTTSMTTGRLVADMMSGREPAIDMTPYRIDRYR